MQIIPTQEAFDFGSPAVAANEPINHGAPDLLSYDVYAVMMSGGKDSMACLLDLLDAGVPKERMELWHHDVDGREGSDLMDWPVTRDYCRKLAEAFNIPLYFSWLEGGFEREMLRDNTRKAPTLFETPDGLSSAGGVRGKLNTRLKFPQVSADLSVRYCSSYLKIDVASAALRNQTRFNGKRVLVVTGERAQESTARSKYATFEPHKADNRTGKTGRHIDHYRPVHGWEEEKVWEIMKRHKVAPHPAYLLGFGRTSCMACIFGSANQWATVKALDSGRFERIANYEEQFGVTIQRKHSVRELAAAGTPYPGMKAEDIATAMSDTYDRDIFIDNWELPAGAFGESTGPI